MRFKSKILERYLSQVPIPLAFERKLEAEIYKNLDFKRPILDVGCGEGLYAATVFAEKIDTGIDPNPVEIKRASELQAYTELLCCKGDAISKPDGYYKTAFSNSVLEHIPEIDAVFCEVFRLLDSGGKFYVTVPSNFFDEYSIANQILRGVGLNELAKRYRGFFNRFWRHYHYYSQDQWGALARKNGFKVLEIHTYGTKETCMLNDFLAPFSIISFILKKVTNRWVWLPVIRKVFMSPVALFGNRFLRGKEYAKNGGLVFMELMKP